MSDANPDIADDWTCTNSGAIVRYGQETCPVCRTTIDGEVSPGWLEVGAWFVRYGLLVCLGWTAFFAQCGLVCALASQLSGGLGGLRRLDGGDAHLKPRCQQRAINQRHAGSITLTTTTVMSSSGDSRCENSQIAR